jgi:hypothetical protein
MVVHRTNVEVVGVALIAVALEVLDLGLVLVVLNLGDLVVEILDVLLEVGGGESAVGLHGGARLRESAGARRVCELEHAGGRGDSDDKKELELGERKDVRV